ncbi:MAG: hypothetical protein JST31_03110 [Actinobacteria bacterium]|nr:hypothetical protein [Actinomycetota bacterium]
MARGDTWTDERLDDLSKRTDEGFADTRAEFRAVRSEMNERFGEMNAQFAAQNRAMVQLFGGMFAVTLVGFLGVIATILASS